MGIEKYKWLSLSGLLAILITCNVFFVAEFEVFKWVTHRFFFREVDCLVEDNPALLESLVSSPVLQINGFLLPAMGVYTE